MVLFALALAKASTPEIATAPTLAPVQRERPLELRVLYLDDPRLPSLAPAQRRTLEAKVAELLLGWFGYHAHLREVGTENLPAFFAAHAAIFRTHATLLRGEIDPAREADRERLGVTIRRTLVPLSLAEIGAWLPSPVPATREEAVRRLGERFLARWQEIRGIPLAGGGTVADPARTELNSYLHWCALMYELEEADLVFTNSMIIDVEEEMPLPVIARGGVVAGNTNANRHNAFGAAAVVGLLPFLSHAPFWLRERGAIPEAERLDAIATLTLHELGHMLLRRSHPADHPRGCVHTPEPALRYYDWHLAIRKNGPCPLPHSLLTGY